MDPVRVKVYGLVSMTRRSYVAQLVVAVLLMAVLLGFWWLRWQAVRATETLGQPTPTAKMLIVVWNHMPWIVAGGCLWMALEAWIVLRLFARKEAERNSQQPPKSA